MSHTFDSALPAPQRTIVAQAIVNALAPLLLPTLGGDADGFLEGLFITSIPIDSKHDLDEIDLLVEAIGAKSPCVAINPRDLKPTQTGGPGCARGDLTVDLYFYSTHLRSTTEGRATSDALSIASDAADPGVWAIVELVWARLFDARLGAGTWLRELKMTAEEELLTDGGKTLWKQAWSVQMTRNANMYRGITQLLERLHTTLQLRDAENTAATIVEDTDV